MDANTSIAELKGEIEALKATQTALLTALSLEINLDLDGIAKLARGWSRMSNADGEAAEVMEKQLKTLEALDG